MRKLLTLSAILLFSVDVFAEEQESKVCEITLSKKTYKGLEKCNKGDILYINPGQRSGEEIIVGTVARVCVIETIHNSRVGIPAIWICEYSGNELEIAWSD